MNEGWRSEPPDSPGCMWCDRPATLLCDATIGVEATGAARTKTGAVAYLVAGIGGELWTCDAPMCAEHRTQVGMVYGPQVDTVDHCPFHAGRAASHNMPVMFPHEADAARREVHAAIRRGQRLKVPE